MGLLRTAGRTAVISGTATAVSGRVAHRQATAYAQQANAQPPAQSAAPPPAAPSSSAAQDETMAKLRELAGLHAQGVLSDAEFAAAKAKVLGM